MEYDAYKATVEANGLILKIGSVWLGRPSLRLSVGDVKSLGINYLFDRKPGALTAEEFTRLSSLYSMDVDPGSSLLYKKRLREMLEESDATSSEKKSLEYEGVGYVLVSTYTVDEIVERQISNPFTGFIKLAPVCFADGSSRRHDDAEYICVKFKIENVLSAAIEVERPIDDEYAEHSSVRIQDSASGHKLFDANDEIMYDLYRNTETGIIVDNSRIGAVGISGESDMKLAASSSELNGGVTQYEFNTCNGSYSNTSLTRVENLVKNARCAKVNFNMKQMLSNSILQEFGADWEFNEDSDLFRNAGLTTYSFVRINHPLGIMPYAFIPKDQRWDRFYLLLGSSNSGTSQRAYLVENVDSNGNQILDVESMLNEITSPCVYYSCETVLINYGCVDYIVHPKTGSSFRIDGDVNGKSDDLTIYYEAELNKIDADTSNGIPGYRILPDFVDVTSYEYVVEPGKADKDSKLGVDLVSATASAPVCVLDSYMGHFTAGEYKKTVDPIMFCSKEYAYNELDDTYSYDNSPMNGDMGYSNLLAGLAALHKLVRFHGVKPENIRLLDNFAVIHDKESNVVTIRPYGFGTNYQRSISIAVDGVLGEIVNIESTGNIVAMHIIDSSLNKGLEMRNRGTDIRALYADDDSDGSNGIYTIGVKNEDGVEVMYARVGSDGFFSSGFVSENYPTLDASSSYHLESGYKCVHTRGVSLVISTDGANIV